MTAETNFAFKAFLSHAYKSPEVNLSFFNLFSEIAEVQFEVDKGVLATNTTRLERMIRSSDAFIGIYPFPDSPGEVRPPRLAETSSRYFRLEMDMAVRSGKPMLVLYDEKYGDLLQYSGARIIHRFDSLEVAGSGKMPSADRYRKAFREFCQVVRARMAYDVELSRDSRTLVGLALPTDSNIRDSYSAGEIDAIRTTLIAHEYRSISSLEWPHVLDRRTFELLSKADWMILDTGPEENSTGILAYLHGQFIPTVRLRRASLLNVDEKSPLERTLFSGVEVGYAKDLIMWDSTETLASKLAERLVALQAPVVRINTSEEAERYFRSASLRKEAIFLSYSSSDAATAEELEGELEKRFRSVFDYRSPGVIRAGKPWIEEIFGQLAASAIGVPLLSKAYFESGNCRHEAEEMVALADAGKMRVIPIKVSSGELHLPPWASAMQYLRYWDYSTPSDVCNEIVRLVSAEES